MAEGAVDARADQYALAATCHEMLAGAPFIANVRLEKSEMVLEGNKEVTQFTLLAVYTRPDPATLRRVPLTMSGSLSGTGGT